MTGWPTPKVRARRSVDDRINLSSNELTHPAVAALVEELVAGFDPASLTRYPIQDQPAAAVAEMLGRTPEELLLTPGSDAAIRLIMLACRGVTDGLLITQDPNYEAWTATADLVGGWRVRCVRRSGENGSGWLPAMVAAARDASPAVVSVSCPNGPDGHAPTLAQLRSLLAVCRERGHLLVLDACYSGFSGQFAELTQLAGPHCVVLLSWSKLFGLAGGRFGVAVAEPALVGFLRAFRQEDHVNVLMLHAARMTQKLQPEFEAVWSDIAASREQLRLWLAEHGIHSPESGGNFLHIPVDRADRAVWLTEELSRRGVRVRNMAAVPGLRDHVRFTVTCGPTRDRFVETVEPLLDGLRR